MAVSNTKCLYELQNTSISIPSVRELKCNILHGVWVIATAYKRRNKSIIYLLDNNAISTIAFSPLPPLTSQFIVVHGRIVGPDFRCRTHSLTWPTTGVRETSVLAIVDPCIIHQSHHVPDMRIRNSYQGFLTRFKREQC